MSHFIELNCFDEKSQTFQPKLINKFSLQSLDKEASTGRALLNFGLPNPLVKVEADYTEVATLILDPDNHF